MPWLPWYENENHFMVYESSRSSLCCARVIWKNITYVCSIAMTLHSSVLHFSFDPPEIFKHLQMWMLETPSWAQPSTLLPVRDGNGRATKLTKVTQWTSKWKRSNGKRHPKIKKSLLRLSRIIVYYTTRFLNMLCLNRLGSLATKCRKEPGLWRQRGGVGTGRGNIDEIAHHDLQKQQQSQHDAACLGPTFPVVGHRQFPFPLVILVLVTHGCWSVVRLVEGSNLKCLQYA